MSDYQIRQLAAACAPRIAAAVESAVVDIVRRELPGTIENVLREQFPGETVRLYVAKRSVSSRRDRDNMIRAEYTGRNARALSAKFGLSMKQIHRIGSGIK